MSGSNIFAGTNDGVYRSTNNGTSWTAVTTEFTNTSVGPLVLSGSNIFTGNSDGVFRSTDNGTSWTALNTGLPTIPLAASGNNIFAASDEGVSLSTDNGATWTAAGSGLPQDIQSFWIPVGVSSIAVNDTNIFAGIPGPGGGVFLTTNNGTNWTAVNTGLPNDHIHPLVVSGSNIFAGTDGGGVYLTTDNGTSWTAANTGLPMTEIISFAVSGNNLFAGTE